MKHTVKNLRVLLKKEQESTFLAKKFLRETEANYQVLSAENRRLKNELETAHAESLSRLTLCEKLHEQCRALTKTINESKQATPQQESNTVFQTLQLIHAIVTKS